MAIRKEEAEPGCTGLVSQPEDMYSFFDLKKIVYPLSTIVFSIVKCGIILCHALRVIVRTWGKIEPQLMPWFILSAQ